MGAGLACPPIFVAGLPAVCLEGLSAESVVAEVWSYLNAYKKVRVIFCDLKIGVTLLLHL